MDKSSKAGVRNAHEMREPFSGCNSTNAGKAPHVLCVGKKPAPIRKAGKV